MTDGRDRAAQDEGAAGELAIQRRGAAAIAVLQRAARRNAISLAMRRELAEWYPQLARDAGVYAAVVKSGIDGVFSVGGDVRELVAAAERDLAEARAMIAGEFELCWLHECFSKPTVSLIDGPVMGTGVGISLYGTHRVAGEAYSLQMPETAIGFFPDCGVCHAFARMPHNIGVYLGLSGAAVGRGDALALGLVTHCIDSAEFAAIEAHLADADPVDPVLDERHRAVTETPLMAQSERIARYFTPTSVTEILKRLESAPARDSDWARATLATLRARSPLALHITRRAIAEAAKLDIRETLIQDFRLSCGLLGHGELREGVRAALIDKDRRPRWSHSRVEDVPGALVDGFFAPIDDGELDLRSRAAMQAARV